MKTELNFEYLEEQWKTRQLDLFPWLEGLFALLRSKESLTRETEKKLSSASLATMVQFLSSDDQNNARIAKGIIKAQDPESILPVLLYSLEKTDKKDYHLRVIGSLLDFKPNLFFGYLLEYLNRRKEQKNKIFEVIVGILQRFRNNYTTEKDIEGFWLQIFKALQDDFEKRIPASKKIDSIEEFKEISPDIETLILIFKNINQDDDIQLFEKEAGRLGKKSNISFSGLFFEFKKDDEEALKMLNQIITVSAVMRLQSGLLFLRQMEKNIVDFVSTEELKGEIIKKAQFAIKLIIQPNTPIREILDEAEAGFLLDGV